MIKKMSITISCLIVLLIIGLLVYFCTSTSITEKRYCDALNQSMICTPVNECEGYEKFVDELNSTTIPTLFTNESLICGSNGTIPKICCHSSVVEKMEQIRVLKNPPTPDITKHKNFHLLPVSCGDYTGDRIIDGEPTGLIDFPWMALISYKSSKNKLDFRCGGSLINNRHILTAAHCVTNLGTSTLAGVRVGEHDLNTNTDCDEYDKDSCVTHQDISIEKVMVHPGFNLSSAFVTDDIAIIRLQQPIDDDAVNILPICLPFTKDIANKQLESESLIVTGWGATESGPKSTSLLKATLPILSNNRCNQILQGYLPHEVSYKQICADSSNGKDSAKGDSGGPLQSIEFINKNQKMVQHGIVSFGVSKRHVSINTRVSYYMDWILDQLA